MKPTYFNICITVIMAVGILFANGKWIGEKCGDDYECMLRLLDAFE